MGTLNQLLEGNSFSLEVTILCCHVEIKAYTFKRAHFIKITSVFQHELRVSLAVVVYSTVVYLRDYMLCFVDVNVIRQENACVLNTAGRTLAVHTVPVYLSDCLSDFLLLPCCSESNSSSLIHPHLLCLTSLPVPFLSPLFPLLVDLKTFTVTSPCLLCPCCCCCVSFVSNAEAPLVTNGSADSSTACVSLMYVPV